MEIILRGMPLIQLKLNFILEHWGSWDSIFIHVICSSSIFGALKRKAFIYIPEIQ